MVWPNMAHVLHLLIPEQWVVYMFSNLTTTPELHDILSEPCGWLCHVMIYCHRLPIERRCLLLLGIIARSLRWVGLLRKNHDMLRFMSCLVDLSAKKSWDWNYADFPSPPRRALRSPASHTCWSSSLKFNFSLRFFARGQVAKGFPLVYEICREV